MNGVDDSWNKDLDEGQNFSHSSPLVAAPVLKLIPISTGPFFRTSETWIISQDEERNHTNCSQTAGRDSRLHYASRRVAHQRPPLDKLTLNPALSFQPLHYNPARVNPYTLIRVVALFPGLYPGSTVVSPHRQALMLKISWRPE